MNKRIKVLHYIPGFKFGGIESIMIDILKGIDNKKYQIDFIILTSLDNYLVDEIKLNGGNVYLAPNISPKESIKNPKIIINHVKGLNNVLCHTNYDIIHSHAGHEGFILFLLAIKQGIKGRIMHVHTSSFEGSSVSYSSIIYRYLRRLMQKTSIHYSNVHLAVSQIAGEWAFGEKNFQVIPNPVDLDKYVFSIDDRKKTRSKYDIKNEIVFGHVGRSAYAKNHKFLFEVFKELLQKFPDSKLMLVGIEQDDKKLNEYINELELSENIIFCGRQSNVSKFYSSMDALIFPSLYEGLGIVLIEAQTSGLQCYCSNTIPKEVAVTNNLKFIDLNESPKVWAEKVSKSLIISSRKNHIKEIGNKGYSLEASVEMFEELYQKTLK